MKLLVINGPNMNLLGIREPDIYGKNTYRNLCDTIAAYCADREVEVSFFQSNHEGLLIDAIQDAFGKFDGLIINPAAYTHTSIAIPDAIRAVGIPAVEVHISDISSREPYRRVSFTADACICTLSGKGFSGYTEAVDILLRHIG